MDFISGILDPITSLNWEVIAQLTMLGLIVVAGPAVILVLASRGGDL
ncbi:photosystem II reaction center protein Ycf12/Psb30 [Argonema galeatum]|nr:photosystem II reaction center protein Ycf12 [Argonema galeatum]MCL1468477.1 photosystem II reaction center protein Ycf12 [Argonema galeatum A003/A1]